MDEIVQTHAKNQYLKPCSFRPGRNSRGQGTVEFILVLIFVTGVVLGIIYQFNDAFGRFVGSYLGDYLGCLIESGELPSLGGQASGTCESLYEPFSLANGRPLIQGDPANQAGGPGSDGGATDQGRARIQSAGAVGSSFGRSGRPASFGADGSGGVGGGSGGAGGDGQSKANADDEFSGSVVGSFRSRQNRPSVMKASETEKTGFMVEQDRKNQNQKATKVREATDEDSLALKKKVMPYRPTIEETKSEDANVTFTLGNFLRYLIIAAILIALVIFFGGQALQISKSAD